MAMIQGIDGSALIQAFRAGRSDRYANEDRLRAQQKEDAERERGEQVQGLMGQLYGGEQPTGVAAQFGAAPPQQPQTFSEAFMPEGIAAAEPPAPQSMPAEPPRRQVNRDVLARLIVLDPEAGGRIVSALKSLGDTDLQAYEAKNAAMGAAAQYLTRYPAEQRAALMRVVMPQLMEAGWTAEELNGANLGDEGLQGYIALSMDTDTLIDNELAEREFQAGKTVPVTAGGNVALVKPDGSARWVIGGGPEGGGEAPVRVQSIEEAQALPPGTHFIDPNGVERIVPGGPTGSAPSGGF